MPVTMTKQQLLTQVYTVLKKKIPASGEPETPHPILEEVLYAILREGVTNADLSVYRYRKLPAPLAPARIGKSAPALT